MKTDSEIQDILSKFIVKTEPGVLKDDFNRYYKDSGKHKYKRGLDRKYFIGEGVYFASYDRDYRMRKAECMLMSDCGSMFTGIYSLQIVFRKSERTYLIIGGEIDGKFSRVVEIEGNGSLKDDWIKYDAVGFRRIYEKYKGLFKKIGIVIE